MKAEIRSELLRRKYPKFIYEKYSWKTPGKNLEIFFNFRVPPGIEFVAKIVIKNVSKAKIKRVGDSVFENLIFHLGLAEMPSYWKATCSPIIEIRAGYLNEKQARWWKNLLMKGMGQFFYENKIDFTRPNFLKIIAFPKKNNVTRGDKTSSPLPDAVILRKLRDGVLVPLGGGKDSVVTIEKLKSKNAKVGCFLVNPKKAAKDIVRISGIKEKIIVERKIDKKLLQLNRKGFLNGHTPFTSVLSFLSVFAAALFDYKNIAFSNEKSADEGNLRYLGRTINHQWSKSSEFEKGFRQYTKKYLAKNLNYFSFLRRYTELEIAKVFTKYPKYFQIFSSCNRSASWCGNCAKCLFVYASLYPYFEQKKLLKIFGKDIFQNKKLLGTMKELIGEGAHKPFECVGTYQESKKAFDLCLRQAKSAKAPLLLKRYDEIRRVKK